MERSEAIDLLDNLIGMVDDNHHSDYDGALHMAIETLEKLEEIEKRKDIVPCSDCQEFECDGCFYKSVRYSM